MFFKRIKKILHRRSTRSFGNKKWLWLFLVLIIIVSFFYFTKIAKNYPLKQDLDHAPDFFGVTFSTKFCEEIGLDWKETYLATLDDLKVKEIRLPIYWDEIEAEPGVYNFSKYDYIISEGEKRGVNFIINIGWRLPRWPECHAPDWANKETLESTKAKVVRMLIATVNHYKDYDSIVAWQLENEPFFNEFGVCPKSDEWFFEKELETVRALDDRPIMISATGELSLWSKEAKLADIFGSTLYRVVWGNWTGYVRYPIPAWFYRFKAYLADIKPENRVIIELQAEPWVPKGSIIYLSDEEANKSFNIDQFKANLQFAINTKFKKAYLWGVEWWYYKYKNGNPEYWELAKTLF
ncbi:MAG: cellulase family glycosylhydrolase [Patescibacteria group bacterium]|nr:cellulase family glycosylhydrolase [Patescibacteria group bacterium]MDD3939882.1 cellulase family glycosylhydrolase [Patescibacteria group bacterium]MDD4443543.1 cellulase family glycosylhydrolase [Patescibacteria group bacterium]